MRYGLIILVLFVSLAGIGADAGELERGESGVVVAVIDGDTIVIDRALDDDETRKTANSVANSAQERGLEIRLIGLQAPKLPLGRKGFTAWPFAPESRQALVDLVAGQTVRLSYGGLRRDRYGRALAQVHRADGLWVQGEMIRRGMARVYSFKDNRVCVATLLGLEREARGARRGLWRLDAYRVRSVAETADTNDRYELVEGTVRAVAEVKGRIFLNFGDDWKSDFTATIAPGDVKAFTGVDVLGLAGQSVRLRGWLSYFNGPNMVLTHPEQLENPAADGARADTNSPCLDGRLI